MLKIGDFSRLSHVSAKALRYYDQIGLFKPAYIDTFTDYRYYSVEQLPRLNRIILLKDLGLSLDFITKEKTMSDYAVTLKALEPMIVASRRTIVPHMRDLGDTVLDLFADIAGHKNAYGDGVSFTGYPLTIYHDEELRETGIDVEAAMAVEGPLEDGTRVKVRTLSPVPEAASVVHKGDLSGLPQAYQAILHWVETNEYEVAGPGREVYLQYDRDGDPADFVTEIQIPVRSRASS